MGPNSSPASTFLLIALMVVAFYFLIIRPNKKRQQAQQQTMSSLTPGTRVLLTSGVFATVVELGERQAVLETSPGVHLTVLKQAIARTVLPSDEDTETDETETDDIENDETDDLDGDGTRHPAGADQDQDPRTGTSSTPTKD